MNPISPHEVMARLRAPTVDEWAFLDLRVRAEAANGHPFGSTNVPFGRLHLEIGRLVPLPATPLVLLDGGDGVARRAAERLEALGRRHISIVAGGIPGWRSAGLPLFEGEHTFSKAFGEWVQHRFGVPDIGPDDLAALIDGDQRPLLIDGRPLEEHRKFTLPGAISCPNAELGLRLPSFAKPGRTIVVHCAGRTRSIIGAQTLRDFGLPNPVVALRDGTQGWELSGRHREFGADRLISPPSTEAVDAAKEMARRVLLSERVPEVDASELGRWAEDEKRTTYLFDPREEAEEKPAAGFRSTPGTTLVQQTDRFIAVKGARVVLWDPELVRAAFGALWLRRLGFEAYVLTESPTLLPVQEESRYPKSFDETSGDPSSEATTPFAGRHLGNLDDARAYLAWETGLLGRLEADGLTPWDKIHETLR
ncbi:sulfurtransferase [Silicimonas algicola]|uniref:3-mercaptopyruvate sulfurtransferase SseA n=1 Tax=Silicimonas algicola TaxID=1826607 RepID=A0A316FX56_9RHOB|nr:rhodanese-like domain-containing protein [Silicimonas algicola]AZQ68322.1 sulfurtransferase [Silicimonas algicola]PWK52705.1 3-mercaptopyruvate sulfurtransferase SseA [Silicimonas algicola]